jgi:hypothetical protein
VLRLRSFQRAGLLLATIAFIAPSRVLAQGPAFGILGGVNFAQIIVDEDEEESETSGRRTSWVLGLYADLQPQSSFSFRPELLLAEKGGEDDDDAEGGTIGINLRYVQLPVLGRFSFGTGPVRPFIVAGPSIAYRIDCELEFTDDNASLSVPCDEGEDVEDDETDPIEKIDISGIIGGGIDFGAFALSARYDHGFSDLAKSESAKVNTRTITFVASFRIGGR